MLRFLTNLFHDSRKTERRTSLQVAGLEDRTVPTVVNFSSGTLAIYDVEPGHTVMIELNNNNQIKVLDNDKAVTGYTPVNKELVSLVHIELDGGNTVIVNDSNGMPFAQDKATAIWIYGNGPGFNAGSGGISTLVLQGSREVAGAESYAEETPATEGVLTLDNLTFNMDNAIYSVQDTIPITGRYTVETFDPSESLENYPGEPLQTLTGRSHDLLFSGKPVVDLQQHGAGATVYVQISQPEASEQTFEVDLEDANESLTIAQTPAGLVNIQVNANGSNDSVNVSTNQSPLYILGNSSTSVDIGSPIIVGHQSTKGIDADIFVVGAGSLLVDDNANKLPSSDIKLTSDEISGNGLFANNGVFVGFWEVSNTPTIEG